MNSLRNNLVLGIFLISALSTTAQQVIHIEVYPNTSRAIQGKLRLERAKYFNLAASGTNIEGTIGDQALTDYYFKDLKMTLGRALGMVGSEVSWGNSVFEDPSRPGFTDLTRLINAQNPSNSGASSELMDILGPNQNVAFHDRHNSYPSFMAQYTKEGSTQSYPVNNEAAAELAATLLEHKFTDWTRPAFYEPVNEPDWRFWSDPRFIEHHTSIQEKVKNAYLPVEVGGPCLSVGYFYKSNFNALSQITDFIDRTQGNLDFYSFHIYDYMSWDDDIFDFTGSVTSGLPTEGVFDAIANHTMNKFGKQFTYVASEHGGYISDAANREYALEKLASLYFPGSGFTHAMEKRSIADFLAVSSELANTFTFMNHPHIVKKAVPFILLESFGWDPKYYASLLVANNFTDNGDWVESKRIHFYEFFRDVEGRRIRSFCDDSDIQHHAFVEDNKLILLFHNLSNVDGTIQLQINDNPGQVKEITARKFGRKPDFRPYLVQERIFSLEDELPIRAREAIALFIEYDKPIEEMDILDEIPYYGNSTSVQFAGSHDFQLDMPDFETAQYAILRVGIGLPSSSSKNVNFSINGTLLESQTEDCADRLAGGGDYGTTRIMRVDTSLLQATNTITVNFPDGQTGGVGATVIRAGIPATDSIEGLDLIQQSVSLYENQSTSLQVTLLPETTMDKGITWESLDPGIATVSAAGLVVGKIEGTTRIIARSEYGGFSDTCSVNVVTQDLVSMADKSGWIAVYADDEGFINGTLKQLAIDNNPATFWHTEWLSEPWKPLPHEIWVDMGDTLAFDRFIYTPRQDPWGPNGNIGEYELYFSNDSANWGTPEVTGTFSWNVGEDNYYKEIQYVDLGGTVSARFFRLVALTEHQGNPDMTHTNAAELDVSSSLTGLTFTSDTVSISVGEELALELRSLPFLGVIPGNQVSWSSMDLTVAGVEDGVLTGAGPGWVKISATSFDAGFTDTLVVEVSIIPVAEILNSREEFTTQAGETVILNAEILPANAYYDSYHWVSDNDLVAKVVMGYVSAVAIGTANIIAISSDGIHRDTTIVTVVDNQYDVAVTLIDDQSGVPVEGALVSIGGDSAQSDGNGVALFSGISLDDYSLNIYKDKYQAISSTVSLPEDTLLSVALSRTLHEVILSVKETILGIPVYNAEVSLGTISGQTNADGRIEIITPWGDFDYTLSKSYFDPGIGSLSIEGDTLIELQLTRVSADLKFRISDSAGILRGSSIILGELSGVTNVVGIYTFNELAANSEYSYQISKDGYQTRADQIYLAKDTTLNVILSFATGMSSESELTVQLYPNPADGFLHLVIPGITHLQVLSMDGVLLREEKLLKGQTILSVNEFDSGLYMLRFFTDEGIEVKRITVIH